MELSVGRGTLGAWLAGPQSWTPKLLRVRLSGQMNRAEPKLLRNIHVLFHYYAAHEWGLGHSCPRPSSALGRSDNSRCVNATYGPAYLCKCKDGFDGNPYILDGCQGTALLYPCFGICKNTIGGYDCRGKFGMKGDAKAGICRASEELKPIIQSCNVIGKGGFGEVYKGLLDNQLVAIKKSINVEKSQEKQFANEIIIQSRVIHKNIVKLIGCCLEVDVPMLVYEFVPRGSFHDILHGSNNVSLTLEKRLNITPGAAEGLAYMHSKTSTTSMQKSLILGSPE
uniref:Protein kinase domain-containing protein n=1 Tax=Leersia perrieri TaxID=77586 RepID=A0A0D9XI55_9ORYZ